MVVYAEYIRWTFLPRRIYCPIYCSKSYFRYILCRDTQNMLTIHNYFRFKVEPCLYWAGKVTLCLSLGKTSMIKCPLGCLFCWIFEMVQICVINIYTHIVIDDALVEAIILWKHFTFAFAEVKNIILIFHIYYSICSFCHYIPLHPSIYPRKGLVIVWNLYRIDDGDSPVLSILSWLDDIV